jgi:DNA-binding MarR family transcriptional regulator
MQRSSSSGGWDPRSSGSYWINRASRVLVRAQEERLRPLGFGMSQMPVLHALQGGAALSQKELAARARVEQPTMAELLARMERAGAVQREPNPTDRRGSLVSLTREAQEQLPKAKAALVQIEHEAMAGLSAAERALLVTLLQRVVGNLER